MADSGEKDENASGSIEAVADPFVGRLRDRIEAFCASAPLEELTVTLHSTGVNYAHQFFVLSLLGRERLRRFRQVNLVSGSAIASVVYYSFQTGNLQWRRDQVPAWERHFFAAHRLAPARSAMVLPARFLSGRPLLSLQEQMDVIRSGIGEDFGTSDLSVFPSNFRFWLYDAKSGELDYATADNHLAFMQPDQIAVATTAVPRLFSPVEIKDHAFVDPMFSPKRKELGDRLRADTGRSLVSNMLVDSTADARDLLRPHRYQSGNLTMVRELMRFCLGLHNPDHVRGLEVGLMDVGSEVG